MRPTTATVRLDAIKQNLEAATNYAPQSKVMAVIKANAYGHGAIEVATALETCKPQAVPAFAVAFMDEAVQLRDAGITRPVLILQGASSQSEFAQAAAKDFWLMLNNRQQLSALLSANLPAPVRIWVKLDTGMHRLGFEVADLDEVIEALSASANVQQEIVLCSHLACADDLQNPLSRRQAEQLRECALRYRLPLSLANSAGIMNWPETHADWNRPGYMLYGNDPRSTRDAGDTDLVPAMTITSRLISIKNLPAGAGVGYGLDWVADKQSKVGVVAIGYGDGYPRHAPSGTPVLVNGQRVPLVGRVSMDMISVDLSALENARIGDPVELWGPGLSVNEVAASAGTIGYELMAGLTGRIPIKHIS